MIDSNDHNVWDSGSNRFVQMKMTFANNNLMSVLKKSVTGDSTEVPDWHSMCTPLGNAYQLISDSAKYAGPAYSPYIYVVERTYDFRGETHHQLNNGVYTNVDVTRLGKRWVITDSYVDFSIGGP